MVITNWVARGVFIFLFFIIAIISSFFPLLIAKVIMFGPWNNPEFDDLLKPRIREARRLLQDNPEEFARRFSDELSPIRIGGYVAWLCFLFALFSLLREIYGF